MIFERFALLDEWAKFGPARADTDWVLNVPAGGVHLESFRTKQHLDIAIPMDNLFILLGGILLLPLT